MNIFFRMGNFGEFWGIDVGLAWSGRSGWVGFVLRRARGSRGRRWEIRGIMRVWGIAVALFCNGAGVAAEGFGLKGERRNLSAHGASK